MRDTPEEQERTEGEMETSGEHPLPEGWMRAARSYNAPPDVPRDEMWRAIEGELTRGRGGGDVVPLERKRRPSAAGALRWAVPAAAAAVLVVGIGIGRMTAPGPAPDPAAIAERDGGATSVEPLGPESTALRTVALEHLGRSGSLLALIRADARAGRVEPDVGQWGRRLLSETRLLLDSPAAADPAMRALLEDLELILAQVAVLEAGGPRPEGSDRDRAELELIARGLEEHDVLSRIDAVLPAGPGTGMTGI